MVATMGNYVAQLRNSLTGGKTAQHGFDQFAAAALAWLNRTSCACRASFSLTAWMTTRSPTFNSFLLDGLEPFRKVVAVVKNTSTVFFSVVSAVTEVSVNPVTVPITWI